MFSCLHAKNLHQIVSLVKMAPVLGCCKKKKAQNKGAKRREQLFSQRVKEFEVQLSTDSSLREWAATYSTHLLVLAVVDNPWCSFGSLSPVDILSVQCFPHAQGISSKMLSECLKSLRVMNSTFSGVFFYR